MIYILGSIDSENIISRVRVSTKKYISYCVYIYNFIPIVLLFHFIIFFNWIYMLSRQSGITIMHFKYQLYQSTFKVLFIFTFLLIPNNFIGSIVRVM